MRLGEGTVCDTRWHPLGRLSKPKHSTAQRDPISPEKSGTGKVFERSRRELSVRKCVVRFLKCLFVVEYSSYENWSGVCYHLRYCSCTASVGQGAGRPKAKLGSVLVSLTQEVPRLLGPFRRRMNGGLALLSMTKVDPLFCYILGPLSWLRNTSIRHQAKNGPVRLLLPCSLPIRSIHDDFDTALTVTRFPPTRVR